MDRNRCFRAGCRMVQTLIRKLLKPDKRWTPKSYIFVTFGEPCPSCRKQPFTIKILSKLLSLFHKDQVVSTLMQDVVCPRTIFSLIWQDSISPLSVSKPPKGYKIKYFPPIQLKMFHLVIKAWAEGINMTCYVCGQKADWALIQRPFLYFTMNMSRFQASSQNLCLSVQPNDSQETKTLEML